MRLDLAAQPGVLDVAGGDDDHPPRRVVAADEADQGVARHRRDDGGVAQHRAAHGLVGVGGGDEALAAQAAGVVVLAGDLLGDHRALHRDVGVIEAGGGEHVTEDGQRVGQRVLQAGDVVGRHLLRGEGVDLGAEALDLDGDIEGAAGGGAFEGHMLEEMRDAALLRCFVARAGANDDHDGGGLEFGQAGGNDR